MIYNNKMLSENIYGYVIPEEESYDIDTELDFKMCEYLMQNIK